MEKTLTPLIIPPMIPNRSPQAASAVTNSPVASTCGRIASADDVSAGLGGSVCTSHENCRDKMAPPET